jgi:hypothetical protein
MHHISKGLFFERLDDNTVVITKTDDSNLPNDDRSNVLFAQKIDTDTFASAFAAVATEQEIKDALNFLSPPKVFNNTGMWTHYCNDECSIMMIGNGEECSWCGCTEVEQSLKVAPLWANIVTRIESQKLVGADFAELFSEYPSAVDGGVYVINPPLTPMGDLHPVITPLIQPLDYDPQN